MSNTCIKCYHDDYEQWLKCHSGELEPNMVIRRTKDGKLVLHCFTCDEEITPLNKFHWQMMGSASACPYY